jgi:predicted transposase YdaD
VKYLQEREKEVIDIMIMLFDQEYAQEQYGRAQMEEGRKEGRKEGIMETLIPLIKDGVLTMKEAASRFGISEEALRKRL